MDIEPTRGALNRMPGWVDDLADRLAPPDRRYLEGRRFMWRHHAETAEVLQVAKAARLVAALRAALALVDARYTTECGSLLRTASDFTGEILFLGEPALTGQTTRALRKFVEQAFASVPSSLDEWMKFERERYVGRGEVLKALGRMAQRTGQDGDLLRDTSSWLSHGFDKYVHGSYDTAMELYDGDTKRFMTAGVQSRRLINGSLRALAWMTQDALMALEFMSFTRGPCPLYPSIQQQRRLHEAALARYEPPERSV